MLKTFAILSYTISVGISTTERNTRMWMVMDCKRTSPWTNKQNRDDRDDSKQIRDDFILRVFSSLDLVKFIPYPLTYLWVYSYKWIVTTYSSPETGDSFNVKIIVLFYTGIDIVFRRLTIYHFLQCFMSPLFQVSFSLSTYVPCEL